jgi:hypothetical protein
MLLRLSTGLSLTLAEMQRFRRYQMNSGLVLDIVNVLRLTQTGHLPRDFGAEQRGHRAANRSR